MTELPTPGTVIGRGRVLYRLDGQPVRLLYGAQAAWRTLAPGVADGADVLQLKRNLKALGFTADEALAVMSPRPSTRPPPSAALTSSLRTRPAGSPSLQPVSTSRVRSMLDLPTADG